MHGYVSFITPIDYCVELSLVHKFFCENCSHFILKLFQPNSFGEVFEESYKNFEHFESALFTTSGSMPLVLDPKYKDKKHIKDQSMGTIYKLQSVKTSLLCCHFYCYYNTKEVLPFL